MHSAFILTERLAVVVIISILASLLTAVPVHASENNGAMLPSVRPEQMTRMRIILGREEYNRLDPHLFGRIIVQSTDPELGKNRFQLAILSKGSDQPLIGKTHLILRDNRIALLEEISKLSAGEFVLRIFATNPEGEIVADERVGFRRTTAAVAAAVKRARMPLKTWAPVKGGIWHFTSAVALPNGGIVDPTNIRLLSARDQKELPAEFAVLERWGPSAQDFIRWMRIEFADAAQEGKRGDCIVEYGTEIHRSRIANPVRVNDLPDRIEVNAGRLSFIVRKQSANFLDRVILDGQPALTGAPESGPFMVDQEGREYRAALDPNPAVIVHEQNALRAVIRITGRHYPSQPVKAEKPDRWPAVLGKYHTYIVAYAGQPYLRIYHTFVITEDTDQVRYRDIGLRIPMTGPTATFGVDGKSITLPVAENPSLFQRDMDDLSLHTFSSDGWKTERARNQKSDGWISLGNTAAVIRDFWQNYPKELEADSHGLLLHFWPRHGERKPDRKLTRSNVGLLWFCHEGDALDFKPPREYLDFVPKTESEEWSGGAAGPGANAMGLAKTHEFLLVFGKPAAPAAGLSDLAALYQQDPHALQSPQSLCASEVFGKIHPCDPKRFSVEEDSIRAPFEFFMQTAERLRDYGMFNFGDLHDSLQYCNVDFYSMHRHWKGAQHGAPRMPWILYARSGNPLYLVMARRHAQHLMDVDTVHYVDERFAAAKNVTGQTFPHFLHWLGGAGPGNFQANQENKFWWYYLTGHPRGLDTAREWIEAIIARPVPSTGREASGAISGIIESYQATWDARLLEPMDAFKQTLFSIEPWKGHWQSYAPYLEKYHQLTRSRESSERLIRWARRNENEYDCGWRRAAYAYWLTRDAGLLQPLLALARNRGLSVFHAPGSKLDGYDGSGDWLAYTYYLGGAPYLLAAASDAGTAAQSKTLGNWQGNVISEQGLGALHFVKEAGQSVTVQGEGTYTTSKAVLIGPDGQAIGECLFGKEKVELSADAPGGEYLLRFTDPSGWRGVNLQCDAPRAVFRIAENGWGFNSGIPAMYF